MKQVFANRIYACQIKAGSKFIKNGRVYTAVTDSHPDPFRAPGSQNLRTEVEIEGEQESFYMLSGYDDIFDLAK